MKGQISRKLVPGLVAVAALAGLIYGAYRMLNRPTGQTRVSVRRGTLSAVVEATGQVRPVREYALSLRTSGTVTDVHVQPGDVVKAGDVLLEIDDRSLQQHLRQAQLNVEIRRLELSQLQAGPTAEDMAAAEVSLAAAEAHLKQLRSLPTSQDLTVAKVSLDKAEAYLHAAQGEYERVKWMPNIGMLPQSFALQQATADYEIAKANYEKIAQGASPEELRSGESEVLLAQARLEKLKKGATADQITVARDQLALAEEDLKQTQEELAWKSLLAPADGTVLTLDPKEGENVFTGNVLARLADLHVLEILAPIDELDVAAVATGQPVSIRLDAFPGETLTGTLQHVAPAASSQRGSTAYDATISFDPGTLPVRPGMAANLTITTEQREGVLLVPNRAVRTLGRRKVVSRLQGKIVQQVEVTTGLSNQSEIEIIGGLNEGDVLVID